MKNVAFALFLVPLPTYQRLPVLRPGATDQQPSLKVPMSGSAASELGSASETGIGTMATSICPREATAITTTTAAEQAQTFQFGPITLSRSDDLKRTLIFFRQCKVGASLRRVWPRRRRS